MDGLAVVVVFREWRNSSELRLYTTRSGGLSLVGWPFSRLQSSK